MSLDEILDRLATTPAGSRDLDADIYEYVYGFKVKRAPTAASGYRNRTWVYLDGSRWVSMLRVTNDISDAVSFAAARVDKIGELIADAAIATARTEPADNRWFRVRLPVEIMRTLIDRQVNRRAA